MTASVRITSEDFDPGSEIAALSEGRGDVGAIATFTGLVRGDDNLVAMTLEQYPAMTKSEIENHAADAERRWPLLGIRIVHRIGRLGPGDRIVFVGVASAHRKAAFEAAEFLMDYLKTRAPFWKFEERPQGGDWVAARDEDDEAVRRWR
jgi:molybdopterin synthase catalytic subunit